MWARSSKLALSRLTFHFKKQMWANMCEVDVLRSGIGPIASNVGLIGNECGPKLNKVGTIESGFGATFKKVDTIGSQHEMKRTLSMPSLIEN